MPGMYAEGEYDLAGFAVGVVERSKIIDGAQITAGDIVLGLASSGAHSNGYSLIRRVLKQQNVNLAQLLDGTPLAELVLAPTRIYVKPLLQLMEKIPVKGLAHITGGGLTENVPRILPSTLTAQLDRASWKMPRLLQWLQQQGNITDAEMLRVFNCGVGMIVVVAPEHADAATKLLQDAAETVYRIGIIRARAPHETQIIVA